MESGNQKGLSTVGMIFHVGNLKESLKKVLEIVNEVSKVVRHDLRTHKSIFFLCNSTEGLEILSKLMFTMNYLFMNARKYTK